MLITMFVNVTIVCVVLDVVRRNAYIDNLNKTKPKHTQKTSQDDTMPGRRLLSEEDDIDSRYRPYHPDTLIDHNIRHVVLGASGCGAFANPTRQIAILYREEIEKRSHSFTAITFAIYSAGYGPGNHTPFDLVFNDPLRLG